MVQYKPDTRKRIDKLISILFKELKSIQKQGIKDQKKITLEYLLTDKMLMIALIRHGIPYQLYELIQELTPLNEKDWSELLDLSTKSLQRYRNARQSFESFQSEKILEMAEVTIMGLDVFGSIDKFQLWLNTPNYALGNYKPVNLLRNSYGKEMIMGELVRINYGILA
jgi:putative toxin-antitoxin system antitoxin component (TIGR02293 family)